MTYDFFSINFASCAGFIFLLIFLRANASLDRKIKRQFYLIILFEFIEMMTYSLELWTTTFETLSPLRLWLSAIGYTVRPFIFCVMLMLAMRETSVKKFPKVYYLPAVINTFSAFSVFFTDIVYSYTPDNRFLRGPLGFFTHFIAVLYLVILIATVIRSHAGRPKLEILIIFAMSLLVLFAMAMEAIFSIRTIGRTSIIMATIFYYMFFQTQVFRDNLSQERTIRLQLEHDSIHDGITGVLNKKAFESAARSILSRSGPHYSSLGFIFLDMDHLKILNDTLGHAAGDTAIADTASAIQSVFRKNDLIGRFGGDEFYVLLPNIPKQRFIACLNVIQSRLQREYSNDAHTVSVSASIGAVYTQNVSAVTYEQLVSTADDALYEAKATGRNCHVIKEI